MAEFHLACFRVALMTYCDTWIVIVKFGRLEPLSFSYYDESKCLQWKGPLSKNAAYSTTN